MKVAYTTGAFDLLHVGHLILLEKARALGDYLVVGVMSDEFIERSKGKSPIIPWQQRMEMVSALRCVDDVGLVGDHTDYGLIDIFHPAVRVIGPEYGLFWGHREALEEMVKRGIEIVRIDRTPSISTTSIVEKIRG